MDNQELAACYFGNVEVVLGVVLKQNTPESVSDTLAWATHRDSFRQHPIPFRQHDWAWILHNRVGAFPGFHASRLWRNPKSGVYHLTARFSCNNMMNPVSKLLEYVAAHAEPTGFIGYISAERVSYPMLIHLTPEGMIPQQVTAEKSLILSLKTFLPGD